MWSVEWTRLEARLSSYLTLAAHPTWKNFGGLPLRKRNDPLQGKGGPTRVRECRGVIVTHRARPLNGDTLIAQIALAPACARKSASTQRAHTTWESMIAMIWRLPSSEGPLRGRALIPRGSTLHVVTGLETERVALDTRPAYSPF